MKHSGQMGVVMSPVTRPSYGERGKAKGTERQRDGEGESEWVGEERETGRGLSFFYKKPKLRDKVVLTCVSPTPSPLPHSSLTLPSLYPYHASFTVTGHVYSDVVEEAFTSGLRRFLV
ncbi:hypothetical protein E2C01_062863 [Portunus trituberculatus]|uniref:Uncharacterized protein n=1 Tax=Portunus trituberculatus TaxID=210409 RepID=A0A5B7H916_PORTR|nr:hypothetical protein [Portunus trituberculatus]